MVDIFSDEKLEITCPECHRKFKETIGRLKKAKSVTCPGCGKVFGLENTSLRKEVEKVDRRLRELNNQIAKLGK
jgi:uncharacterized Zn-finger protein